MYSEWAKLMQALYMESSNECFLGEVRWIVSYNDGEALTSESLNAYNSKADTFGVSSLIDGPDVKF